MLFAYKLGVANCGRRRKGQGDMQENRAEKFRQEAAECRRRAEGAVGEDKQAWLTLAEDWSKLARGQDLKGEWQRMRDIYQWFLSAQTASRRQRSATSR
jgi:hypothetical protein